MKYVGATDWFIRWPFLLEGIALGFIGGSIAAFLLIMIYAQISQEIYDAMAFFPLIPQYPFINYIVLASAYKWYCYRCSRKPLSRLKDFLEFKEQ